MSSVRFLVYDVSFSGAASVVTRVSEYSSPAEYVKGVRWHRNHGMHRVCVPDTITRHHLDKGLAEALSDGHCQPEGLAAFREAVKAAAQTDKSVSFAVSRKMGKPPKSVKPSPGWRSANGGPKPPRKQREPQPIGTTRRCPRCKIERDRSEFYTGKNHLCKPCTSDYNRERRTKLAALTHERKFHPLTEDRA